MKSIHLTLTLALALCLTACSAHTEYHGINPIKALAGDYAETVVLEEEAAVWVGFIESPWLGTGDIERLCPNDKGYIKKYKSFGSGLLQLVTIGIYTSIDVEIGCMTEQGGTLRIRLTREKALALAADAAFVELMTNIDPAFADRAEVAHTIAVLEGR
jgi:hypothetical protein